MMFTIKYVYPHSQEMLAGPYSQISVAWADLTGAEVRDPQEHGGPTFVVLHCHNQHGDCELTLGPNLPDKDQEVGHRRLGRAFVMNEAGATVAKYVL